MVAPEALATAPEVSTTTTRVVKKIDGVAQRTTIKSKTVESWITANGVKRSRVKKSGSQNWLQSATKTLADGSTARLHTNANGQNVLTLTSEQNNKTIQTRYIGVKKDADGKIARNDNGDYIADKTTKKVTIENKDGSKGIKRLVDGKLRSKTAIQANGDKTIIAFNKAGQKKSTKSSETKDGVKTNINSAQ